MTKWIERYRRQAEERYRASTTCCGPCPTTRASCPRHLTHITRQEPHHEHRPPTTPRSKPIPASRSCGSPASSTPRRRRSSARTPIPTLVVQWLGPRRHEMTHRPLRLSHRRLVPIPASQRRQRVRIPRLLPRGPPDELIVQTFMFEGMPDGVALERLMIEDLGNGRADSSPRRSSTRSRAATRSWQAAWKWASARDTSVSTRSCPP